MYMYFLQTMYSSAWPFSVDKQCNLGGDRIAGAYSYTDTHLFTTVLEGDLFGIKVLVRIGDL